MADYSQYQRPEVTHQAFSGQPIPPAPPQPKLSPDFEPNTATLSNKGNEFFLSGKFLPPNFCSLSRQVSKDIVNYVCRHDRAFEAPCKTTIIMRNLVDDTLKNRLDMMCHLVTTLDIRRREQLDLINDIVSDMFADQLVTWGRIVTLCTFCGYLARFCEERCIPNCAEDVSQILGNVIINRLGLWIVANGGWSAFERQFPTVCMFEKSGMWKGVAIIALLIGAVVAFYSSVRFING